MAFAESAARRNNVVILLFCDAVVASVSDYHTQSSVGRFVLSDLQCAETLVLRVGVEEDRPVLGTASIPRHLAGKMGWTDSRHRQLHQGIGVRGDNGACADRKRGPAG